MAAHVARHLVQRRRRDPEVGVEVAQIHPKAIPVLLLDEPAATRWLRGDNDDALALQRSANEDVLELLPLEKAA